MFAGSHCQIHLSFIKNKLNQALQILGLVSPLSRKVDDESWRSTSPAEESRNLQEIGSKCWREEKQLTLGKKRRVHIIIWKCGLYFWHFLHVLDKTLKRCTFFWKIFAFVEISISWEPKVFSGREEAVLSKQVVFISANYSGKQDGRNRFFCGVRMHFSPKRKMKSVLLRMIMKNINVNIFSPNWVQKVASSL